MKFNRSRAFYNRVQNAASVSLSETAIFHTKLRNYLCSANHRMLLSCCKKPHNILFDFEAVPIAANDGFKLHITMLKKVCIEFWFCDRSIQHPGIPAHFGLIYGTPSPRTRWEYNPCLVSVKIWYNPHYNQTRKNTPGIIHDAQLCLDVLSSSGYHTSNINQFEFKTPGLGAPAI